MYDEEEGHALLDGGERYGVHVDRIGDEALKR